MRTTRWKAKFDRHLKMVELSILDQGVGIQKTLSRNPHLEIRGDEDALRLAIKPGISGRAYVGGPKLRSDVWANSGYGLFMTSQICAKGGSFAVCSGDRGLSLSADGEKVFDVGFSGTAIRLCIYVPELRALNEALAEFSRHGEELAGQVANSRGMTASLSSRSLTNTH